MNGIIHPCCHPEGGKPQPANEAEMFENVAALLDNMVAKLKPTKVLFLAIDGVAPRAKMNQQRARRFRSQADAKQARAIEANLRTKMRQLGQPVPPPRPPAWDHNVITPGTKFMADLTIYLRKLTAERVSYHPDWKHLAVILSDASVPGEGEHKLIEFVRRSQGQLSYDPNARHVIVGDDADLIMLALATHELHFTIVRTRRFVDRAAEAEAAAKAVLAAENRANRKASVPARAAARAAVSAVSSGSAHLFDGAGTALAVQEAAISSEAGEDEADTASQWQLLHISTLREYLHQEFAGFLRCDYPPTSNDAATPGDCSGDVKADVEFERLIDDFVFLCFLVGNDFLPHLPSLDIREGALDVLLQLYKSTVLAPKLGRRASTTLLDGDEGQQDLQWLTEAGDVNFAALYPLIERLGEVETAILDRRQKRAARESKPKNQTQCVVFARQGHCREGDSCPFLHGDICPLDAKNAAAETEMRKKLQAFAASGADEELSMGVGMNSYQRRVCHQMADDYQLGHESRGDGHQRQIYVWRLAASAQPSAMSTDDSQQERDAGMIKESFDNALRAAIEQAEQVEAQALDDGLILGQGDDWCGDYYQVKFGRRPVGSARPAGTHRSRTSGAVDSSRVPPEGLIHEYLQGLQWVLHYYYNGVPSWSWFFPFHYAPTAIDLARTLRPRPDQPTGSYSPTPLAMSTPLDPLSQLMGVLPAASATSLPIVCQDIMTAENSPLADFYPADFVLDPNGARMRWQWLALLPFIDESRLRRVVAENVLPHLSKEEKARNAKGVALLFAHRESVLGNVLASKLGDCTTQFGKAAKVELQLEASGHDGAGAIDSRSLPLPGKVWLPKRRVSKALAKLDGANAVTFVAYALPAPTASRRTIGVQQGAIPPPPVLRPPADGQRRGARPRMLLVDLQAGIRSRKRKKQQEQQNASGDMVATGVPDGRCRDRRRGGRGSIDNSTTRFRGRGRGRGLGRGRGRGTRGSPRSVALGAGRTEGAGSVETKDQDQQQQLFVLDRVGTGMQSKTAKRRLCDSRPTAAMAEPYDAGAKKRHKKKSNGKDKGKKEKRNEKKKGLRESPDADALFAIDRTGANGS